MAKKDKKLKFWNEMIASSIEDPSTMITAYFINKHWDEIIALAAEKYGKYIITFKRPDGEEEVRLGTREEYEEQHPK